MTAHSAKVAPARRLLEMAAHAVTLRQACSPASERWTEAEERFNSVCDLEVEYQLGLTVEMLEQGIDYLEDRSGRFYAALACIAGHPGSLYAHVAQKLDVTTTVVHTVIDKRPGIPSWKPGHRSQEPRFSNDNA